MIGRVRSRRRINGLATTVARRISDQGQRIGRLWRRSLQLRVVVSTLAMSLVVILVLGFVLSSQITDRMLDAKVQAATEEIERARGTVDRILDASDAGGALENRLETAKTVLADPGGEGAGESTAGAFQPVIIVPGTGPRAEVSAGPVRQVPGALREFVLAGKLSYQYTELDGSESRRGPALVIGSPAGSDMAPVELYLVYPLDGERQTLALVRGILLTGGLVLLGLLAAISLLVTRQVVLPVRSAARIAERFAGGRLKERMPVHGEDDMARLAEAFNDMAENLSRQITRLEEYGNLQKRFTSDVSHELRTPLTTVRMAADMIHDSREDLDPILARSAELMIAELDRFESLLGDLLEISRHDAGVAELSLEEIDVRGPVRAAMDQVAHLAEETGSELMVDLPDDPVSAAVDPRRVERVVRNLLANAYDHGEGRPVLLRLRGDLDSIAVLVCDQGVGLRPGEEELVFNRFWRADPSRMRRSGGTGLGLAISWEDVRLHNGRLEAAGVPGSGACFRMTLPRRRGGAVFVGSPLPLRGSRALEAGESARTPAPAPQNRPAAPHPETAGEAGPGTDDGDDR